MDSRKETAAAPISRIDYSDLAKAIAGVLSAAPMTAAEGRKRAKANAERAKAIAKVLGSEPMTMRDINAALGTDYSALQVADAVKKYIPGAESCEVMRTVTNSRGEKVERVYAAYFLK